MVTRKDETLALLRPGQVERRAGYTTVKRRTGAQPAFDELRIEAFEAHEIDALEALMNAALARLAGEGKEIQRVEFGPATLGPGEGGGSFYWGAVVYVEAEGAYR